MRESRGSRQKSKLERERLLYVKELGFLSLVVMGNHFKPDRDITSFALGKTSKNCVCDYGWVGV